MLRITTLKESDKSVRVALCGQFTGEYVEELQHTLANECAGTPCILLDLSRVTFVDREAMVFLCAAKSKNVSIENIPSYVSRWITQERRCGSSARQTDNPESEPT